MESTGLGSGLGKRTRSSHQETANSDVTGNQSSSEEGDGMPVPKRVQQAERMIKLYSDFPFTQSHYVDSLTCELPDAIKSITNNKYEYLAINGLSANNYSASKIRKVLASIVMVQETENPSRTNICLVALGAGSKSILPSSLGTHGDKVQDCHAEVLARRGLLRFLYAQLKTLMVDGNRENSIFKEITPQRFCLKEGLSFHLYISRPPCGDAAVFGLEENHPNRLRRGVARATPCNGEGAVYIPYECDPTFSELENGQKRLHKMCCSAKIAKWNVVGVQGALLSRLITPIYLKSITIGSEFNEGHMRRAVYERMRSIRDLPNGYEVNCPDIHAVTNNEEPNNQEAHMISLNWCLMNERARNTPYELIKCESGKTISGENSRLAKVALYRCFVNLSGPNAGHQRRQKYSAIKLQSGFYQQVKEEVCACFERKQYKSRWLKMPPEVDDFELD